MIIDAHAHLSDTDYGNVGLYLEQMRAAGIDKGVVVPGGMLDVRRMTDYIIGKAQPENRAPKNAYVRDCCQTYASNLFGFVCLDPHDPDVLSKLEEAFNAGYHGLKLSPMTHQFSFAGKVVAELASFCGEKGIPLYSHVLYNPGASTAKFVALARQFPKTFFILGHMGFGPADQEGLAAATELDNFFLETSTGNFLHLKEAAKRVGPSKLIFGSEFPLSHPAVELEKVLLLGLKDGDREKVTGGNIRALLRRER